MRACKRCLFTSFGSGFNAARVTRRGPRSRVIPESAVLFLSFRSSRNAGRGTFVSHLRRINRTKVRIARYRSYGNGRKRRGKNLASARIPVPRPDEADVFPTTDFLWGKCLVEAHTPLSGARSAAVPSRNAHDAGPTLPSPPVTPPRRCRARDRVSAGKFN